MGLPQRLQRPEQRAGPAGLEQAAVGGVQDEGGVVGGEPREVVEQQLERAGGAGLVGSAMSGSSCRVSTVPTAGVCGPSPLRAPCSARTCRASRTNESSESEYPSSSRWWVSMCDCSTEASGTRLASKSSESSRVSTMESGSARSPCSFSSQGPDPSVRSRGSTRSVPAVGTRAARS